MVRTAIVALLAALFGVVAIGSGVAHADNEVITSEPADGTTLAASPTAIVINFTEEVGELRVVSLECNAEPFTLERPSLSGNNRVLTVPIPDPLPKGLCVISWLVADIDGEPNGDGLISFTVENDSVAAPATEPAAETTTATDVAAGATADSSNAAPSGSSAEQVVALDQVESGRGPLWLGRMLSTLGIAVVFGALFVIAAAWPEGVEYLITVRFLRAMWALALVGTLLFTSAAAAAVTGASLGSGFNPGAWLDLVDAGWSGRAALLRLVLVVASAWAAFRPDRVIDPVTQFVAIGVPALAVVLIGIDRTNGNWAAIGILLGIAHAVAMAVWLGGAILLARVVLAGPGEEDLVHAVRGYGRMSVVAIVTTIITGFAQMVRLDGGQLFNSGHGRVVILKVVLVAAMIFIALSARQFAQHRLARAHEMTVPMADRLRRAFGTEAAIGIVTLMASAWLLALNPANVSTEPSISYAIERRIEIVEADLDVTVKLTRATVGASGLEVRVDAPAEGLRGLEVVLIPPSNPTIGEIVQPVPLTGPGRAVRLESAGLPLSVAGDWLLRINAATAAGVVQSDPIQIHDPQRRRHRADHVDHRPAVDPGPDRNHHDPRRHLAVPGRHHRGGCRRTVTSP